MMTHETDHKSIEDLVVSNTIQFDTLYRVLIDKKIFTEGEFNEKLKEVQIYYQNRSKSMGWQGKTMLTWRHSLLAALIGAENEYDSIFEMVWYTKQSERI